MSAIPATSYTSRVLVDGTLALTVHIEPSHRLDAQKLFSGPGTAMALAALVTPAEPPAPTPAPEPAKPRRERMGPLCEWAVYRCGEPKFQYWIGLQHRARFGGELGSTPDDAAGALRALVGVSSRKELDTPEIAERFKAQIMQPYSAWLGGLKE